MKGPVCSKEMSGYFANLKDEAHRAHSIATECRSKGFDPSDQVEIPFADDLAGRVEKLVGPEGVAVRIRELAPRMSREQLCLKIAQDVARELLDNGEGEEKALDQSTRTGLAILTEGVLVAPLEGIAEVAIGRNHDGTRYADIFFAGPIRAAGGTAQALSVLIADMVRKSIGIGTYIPTDKEIARTIEEFQLYKKLQYNPSHEEIELVMRRCPVCINGEGTEKVEVQGNRDLPRVGTNQVRSGVCLVIAEGILLKAKKILKITKALEIRDWDFLEELRPKGKDERKERDGGKEKGSDGLEDLISPDEAGEEIDPLFNDDIDEEIDTDGFVFGEDGDTRTITLTDKGIDPTVDATVKYIKDLIAGRPVFSHPSRPGGFRLRYGRGRTCGLATIALNPYSLFITEEFLALGTQVKIERPGKAGAVTTVDTIDGAIVLLLNGDLIEVNDRESLSKARGHIRSIVDIGEVLIPFGEFAENNHKLIRGSYNEDWWKWEVQESLYKRDNGLKDDHDPFAESLILEEEAALIREREMAPFNSLKENDHWNELDDKERSRKQREYEDIADKAIKAFLEEAAQRADRIEERIDKYSPRAHIPKVARDAFRISEELSVPLHPRWTLFWHDISLSKLNQLRNHISERGSFESEVLTIPADREIKEILITLCCLHKEREGSYIVEEMAYPLLRCLGLDERTKRGSLPEEFESIDNVMDAVSVLSGVRVVEKALTRIGARMGRPEKADLRKMKPPVHGLYPVGQQAGPQRLLKKTFSTGVEANTIPRLCENCKTMSPYQYCPDCRAQTLKQSTGDRRERMALNTRDDAIRASRMLGFPSVDSLPDLKGVKGLISKEKIPERLEKGMLRAKHDVFVFRDGTIRYDMTDITLTHFRPREIEASVDRLKELGYSRDVYGEELRSEDQLLELKAQDVVVHKGCGDYLVKISRFIDDELVLIYGQEPYYNAKKREDMIGRLCIGLAPHTSAGVLCRLIGYTNALGCFGHPYYHAAKRRNCDGDEDAILLLMDGLLNFSRTFLPERRGGQMDTPLVLSMRLDPSEVDKEAHNVDLRSRYPLDFYRASAKGVKVNDYWMHRMDTIKSRLGTERQYESFMFSMDTNDINFAPSISAYKTIGATGNKIDKQLELATLIRAVDEDDVAERVLTTHLLPDLIGNLRSYAQQSFRCTKCGTKYRRIPLSGKCNNILWSPKPHKCNNKLILTVSEGSVRKYLGIAQNIASTYDVSNYLRQRIDLMSKNIETMFPQKFKEATLDTFM